MGKWKIDFLDLADQIGKLLARHPVQGRVMALAQQYGKVFRALLLSEVNGGLDECYMEFPDAPSLEGCQEDEQCYCDLLKERDDFIISKGLWMEFVGQLERKQDGEKAESIDDTEAS